MKFRDIFAAHFDKIVELSVLVFIFVFATAMLAAFPMREEMARWIENGAVIAIIARAFGGPKGTDTTKSEDQGRTQ